MKRFAAAVICLLILVSVVAAGQADASQASAKRASGDQPILAATPPMGWNSWDGYGTTVKEADVKANAKWLAETCPANLPAGAIETAQGIIDSSAVKAAH